MNNLTNLVNEFNYKRDIIDNHTEKIADGIRLWCEQERVRIEKEYYNLCEFFINNISIFDNRDNFYNASYTDGLKCYYVGRLVITKKGNKIKIEPRNEINFTDNVDTRGFSMFGPVSKFEYYQWDYSNKKAEYWTICKNLLGVHNKVLEFIITEFENAIGKLIKEQENKFENIKTACEEIDKENEKENYKEVVLIAKIRV